MRKHVSRVALMSFALAGVASVAGAQAVRPAEPAHVSLGIIAGGNFAKWGGDDAGDVDRRTAFMGGAYVDVPIGTTGLSIQPRLVYSMEGAREEDVGGEGTNNTYAMNYLRLPVMVRYTLPTAGSVRPFFSAGPALGMQTGCKLSADNGGIAVSLSCDEVNSEIGGGFENRTFDLSGDVEFGLEFPMGRRNFSVGGIYSHGLTDTFKDLSIRNRVLSVFAAFGF